MQTLNPVGSNTSDEGLFPDIQFKALQSMKHHEPYEVSILLVDVTKQVNQKLLVGAKTLIKTNAKLLMACHDKTIPNTTFLIILHISTKYLSYSSNVKETMWQEDIHELWRIANIVKN